MAVALSDGHFRLDGCKQRRYVVCQDGSPSEEIQEWSIVVCNTEEDGDTTSAHYNDGSPSDTGFHDVSAMPGASTFHIAKAAANSSETSPSEVRRSSSPNSPTRPQPSGRKSFSWQTLRTRLVLDRFCIQVRYKEEDLTEDAPHDVWWLRLRWLPPMVAGKKDTLGSLTMFRHRLD